MPDFVRILVVGDLHLGARTYGLTERIRDHAAVLLQITAYAWEQQPDLLISLGDTFDNPSPDSFSCDAFRRFAEDASQKGRRHYIALTGNHDREKLDLDMTRVRSLGGRYVSPPGTYQFPAGGCWDEADSPRITLRAFDWMPAADIARELAAIEPDSLDVLCLHQSIEGLKPTVANPEVCLEQLRGKARLVLAGDIHVNKSIDAGGGTTVISTGSTEMCASDEDPNKVVKLVTYDARARSLVETVDLPLRTRAYCSWNIRTENEMLYAASVLPGYEERSLHFVSYAPEFAHRIEELEKAAAARGDLMVATPIPTSAEEGLSFLENKQSADAEMEEIIAGRHDDDDAERVAAVSMWQHPENVEVICQSLQPQTPDGPLA